MWNVVKVNSLLLGLAVSTEEEAKKLLDKYIVNYGGEPSEFTLVQVDEGTDVCQEQDIQKFRREF